MPKYAKKRYSRKKVARKSTSKVYNTTSAGGFVRNKLDQGQVVTGQYITASQNINIKPGTNKGSAAAVTFNGSSIPRAAREAFMLGRFKSAKLIASVTTAKNLLEGAGVELYACPYNEPLPTASSINDASTLGAVQGCQSKQVAMYETSSGGDFYPTNQNTIECYLAKPKIQLVATSTTPSAPAALGAYGGWMMCQDMSTAVVYGFLLGANFSVSGTNENPTELNIAVQLQVNWEVKNPTWSGLLTQIRDVDCVQVQYLNGEEEQEIETIGPIS